VVGEVSSWTIPVPSSEILLSAVLVYRADRQTDRQTDSVTEPHTESLTDADEHYIHVTNVGISNKPCSANCKARFPLAVLTTRQLG